MNACRHFSFSNRTTSYQHGFTLIELMISLLLGILVVIAVSSVFISGRQAYGTTQGLNRIQENQRLAFEMMASDIRSAGSYTCPGLTDPVWQVGTSGEDWPETRYMLAVGLEGNSPLVSYEGKKDDPGKFDSIILSMDSAINGLGSSAEPHYYPLEAHKAPGDDLVLSGNGSADILEKNTNESYFVVCNIDTAIVFGATQLSNQTITVGSGVGANNRCGKHFSRNPADITNCSDDEPAKGYCFLGNLTQEFSDAEKQACGEWSSSQAFVVSLADYQPAYTSTGKSNPYANSWYVDIVEEEENGIKREKKFLTNPARGGRIAEGVSSLQLRYRLRGTDKYITAEALRDASPVFEFKRQGVGTITKLTNHKYASDWSKVDSVYLKITFQSPDGIKGTDGNALERSLETYIAVRSHILEY